MLKTQILLFSFIFLIFGCAEKEMNKEMSVEQKDAIFKERVKNYNVKEANKYNITVDELLKLNVIVKNTGIPLIELPEYKETQARNSNLSVEELTTLKKNANNLGLTLYQYQDKLEKEKRDDLLIESLNKLNNINNSNITNNINQNDLAKTTYKNNIKKEYNFTKTNVNNPDSFALVIGINNYKQNTSVEFADLSALAFEDLAINTLGIPKENIITLLNDDATSGQLKAKFELIKELADSNGNLYVYFAGHGVPGKDGNTYILPNDMSADSIHLEPNLQLNTIYSKLAKSSAKNVFVFMDSCFSGKDDKGELLYKGVAPILKRNVENSVDNKLTVLTAGGANDFANDYSDKKQRLFSYFLIKELSSGKSDLNEVYSSIKNEIKRTSLMKGIGYKQVPEISGLNFNLN